jgi:hypothetical protein
MSVSVILEFDQVLQVLKIKGYDPTHAENTHARRQVDCCAPKRFDISHKR